MDLLNSVQDYNESLQLAKVTYSGLMGLAIGGTRKVNIETRAGYVYIRLRDNLSEVIQAYNDKVSPVYDFPVLVERRGNRWYVTGKDDQRYETFGTSAPFLPQHGDQHSFNRDGGGGGDTVWVYPDQFMPLLVYPSGTMGAGNLLVAPYVMQRTSDYAYVGNTGTPNLLIYKPTNSQAIVGLVYIDKTTGNPGLLIASGTPIAGTITGTAQIIQSVPYPSSNQEALYAFRLVSGTSSVTWNNLYNVRQLVGRGSATTGSSGGGGTWGSIGGTLSDQADLQAALDGKYNLDGHTAARVVYTDSSGTVSTSDSLIFTNDNIGIGDLETDSFHNAQIGGSSGNTPPSDAEGASFVQLNSWGSGVSVLSSYLKGLFANGTKLLPTAITIGQKMLRVRGGGYDGIGSIRDNLSTGELSFYAAENFSSGSHGTGAQIFVTPTGTATIESTPSFDFMPNGNMGLKSGKQYLVNGIQHLHVAGDITGVIPSPGWISYNSVIPSRTASDDPTYTLQFAGVDLTGILEIGQPIKLTQNSIVRYGWISSTPNFSTNTSITVLTRTDDSSVSYDILDTSTYPITDFHYGLKKTVPFGMPSNPTNWDVVITSSTTYTKTSPTQNVWYGETNAPDSGSMPDISIPIGLWKDLVYSGLFRIQAPESEGFARIEATLSTSGNSASDADLSQAMTLAAEGEISGGNIIVLTPLKPLPKVVSITSKTSYYLLMRTTNSSAASILTQGASAPTVIRTSCAFL